MLGSLLIFLTLRSTPLADPTTDRNALTQGVTEIVAPGAVPGGMIASAPAFVVLTAKEDDRRAPLFVATTVDKGRAIAGGHGAFFEASNLKAANNGRFLLNCVTWLGGKPIKGLRVGQLDSGAITPFLNSAGAIALDLKRQDLESMLSHLDVLCLSQASLDGDKAKQAAVVDFMKNGHGVLISGCLWGWEMQNRGKDFMKDHTGNSLLQPFGIAFHNGTVGGSYGPADAENPLYTTDGALAALKKGDLSRNDSATASRTIERALNVLPGTELTDQIAKLVAADPTAGIISPEHKVTGAMPLARLRARLEINALDSTPPAKVKADPSADIFPGAVPSTARRIDKSVIIDTSVPDWHGTGLYAAPGEMVSVEIDPKATRANLSVQIGSHTDRLWENESWSRPPQITMSRPLQTAQTRIASPFGGMIFIVVPWNVSPGQVTVTIHNAVPAPRFVRGETSASEWRTAKNNEAPWAELVGKWVAISVPSTVVRNIQDPDLLMSFWDQMMLNAYDFYAAPKRRRQERYCADRQITNGYMHSGYPIMTHDDVAATFTDLAKLRAQGNTWGFYHEMGHNFQQSAWTFDGTGEVTNNLFSLYASEKMNGITPATYGKAHPAMDPSQQKKRLEKYLAAGAKFETWKDDPFLALTMYTELREAFGWESFTKVFAEYQRLPRDEQPKTEMAKHDQWMVRFSKAIGKNLGPFFIAWGVPTTEAARKAVQDLPVWMPADWPKEG